MFLEKNIDFEIESFSECEIESKSEDECYNSTFLLVLTFQDVNEFEWVGDLFVYLVVNGFKKEGFEGGVDIYFNIPSFRSNKGDGFLNETEAYTFIFSNYGKEIQEVIDKVSSEVYDHYDIGEPLPIY